MLGTQKSGATQSTDVLTKKVGRKEDFKQVQGHFKRVYQVK